MDRMLSRETERLAKSAVLVKEAVLAIISGEKEGRLDEDDGKC